MKKKRFIGAIVCLSACLLSPLSFADRESRAMDEFLENKEQGKLTWISDAYIGFELISGETILSNSDIPDSFRKGDVVKYGYDRDGGTHLISRDGSTAYITVSNRYHPIDYAMDYCTEKYSDTAGMSYCIITATNCWRIEPRRLNKALLKQSPSPRITKLLETTQSEWLTYKATLVKYYAELYIRGDLNSFNNRACLYDIKYL
jgi:hypothetical protein